MSAAGFRVRATWTGLLRLVDLDCWSWHCCSALDRRERLGPISKTVPVKVFLSQQHALGLCHGQKRDYAEQRARQRTTRVPRLETRCGSPQLWDFRAVETWTV